MFEETVNANDDVNTEREADLLEDDDDSSASIENRRSEERQRRSAHWDVNTSDNAGTGKRLKTKRSSYGFAQRRKMACGLAQRRKTTMKQSKVHHTLGFLPKEFKGLEKTEKNKSFKHAHED